MEMQVFKELIQEIYLPDEDYVAPERGDGDLKTAAVLNELPIESIDSLIEKDVPSKPKTIRRSKSSFILKRFEKPPLKRGLSEIYRPYANENL